MTFSSKSVWLLLLSASALFFILWFFSVIAPRHPSPFTLQYFSPELVAKSTRYHRLNYLIWGLQTLLPLTLLVFLCFSGSGRHLWANLFPGSGFLPLKAILAGLVLYLAISLLTLPLDFYQTYFLEKAWGFSQQTLGGWMLDWLKNMIINLVLLAVIFGTLWWLMGRWPGRWWLAGAGLSVLFTIMGSLFWPVLIEPWFNHFTPLKNPPLEESLRTLSRDAGLKIDKILVSDASIRTTKSNAYFSGLGWTKRIVLYDTLLKSYTPGQIRLIMAHEIGHWRHNHIWKGLMLGALEILAGLALLGWLLYGATRLPWAWFKWREPSLVVMFFLFVYLSSFLSLPFNSYISRQFEKEADAEVLRLTGESRQWLETEVKLAAKNLSDFEPAPFVRWLTFTHPSPKERIQAALSAQHKSP